ncbi:MAG: DUF1269 domain-containing protein [Chitinophagales bacterium]|nr:DUF1269 domain-containing protein [Chitinophagales bacterium]
MSYFKAFTFSGKNEAGKALDKLEWNNTSYYWLDDVAEISVNKRGTYRVHSTWAQDSSNVPGGIGYGALVGGLIGSLLGPAGTAAGAALGGSMGGFVGASLNVEFNDPVLDTFAASLLPDTSALVIIGDQPTIAAVTAALVEYKVQAFETELDKDAEKALRKALNTAVAA